MVSHIFRPSGRLFLLVLAAAGMACFSVSAMAAPPANVVAGCNQDVWNALSAKAEAQVAYDDAVIRQFINKPDSVLTLTCFDQAAGVSAAQGGAIFAGNFTTQLQTIMPVNGGGVYNCNQVGLLWNAIATQGVNTGAPYATFNDLLTGTLPAPGAGPVGQDFTDAWNADQAAGIFTNLQTAVAQLPVAPQPLNFANAKSSCDVLLAAQIIPGPCP
jgi:hypothetical protein